MIRVRAVMGDDRPSRRSGTAGWGQAARATERKASPLGNARNDKHLATDHSYTGGPSAPAQGGSA
jgi:hypothetical protein